MSDIPNRKSELEYEVLEATKALENQWHGYKDKGKTALTIAGILLAGYAVTKLFDEEEEEQKIEVKNEPQSSFIGSALSGLALSLGTTLIKNTLVNYIGKTYGSDTE
ncbi:MAG: hypothetical protein ACRCVT_00155 [Leadbetterella sp.]